MGKSLEVLEPNTLLKVGRSLYEGWAHDQHGMVSKIEGQAYCEWAELTSCGLGTWLDNGFGTQNWATIPTSSLTLSNHIVTPN